LITDPDENIATLYGPDGSATIFVVRDHLRTDMPLQRVVSSPWNVKRSGGGRRPTTPDGFFQKNMFLFPGADSDFGASVSMTSSLIAIGAPATAVQIHEKVTNE
jgi:hypothetical protein